MASQMYGMLGALGGAQLQSQMNYSPGQVLQVNGTDNTLLFDPTYAQSTWVTTTGTTATNAGWGIDLSQMQQALGSFKPPAIKKKVMTFLEELREEISGWHGSLGAL